MTCKAPPLCKPGVTTESYWVEPSPGACPVYITVTTIVKEDCKVDKVATDANGNPWTGPLSPVVTPPQHVVVCNTGSSSPGVRRDFEILCEPGTGNRVIYMAGYDPNAGITSPPTVAAYNLDGTPYTGNIALLESCGGNAERYDITRDEFCDGTTTFIRNTFWNTTTVIPTIAAIVWQNADTGLVVPTPSGPLTLGRCAEQPRGRLFLAENTGTLSIDDIQTATAGGRVHSIVCYQLSGTGTVTAFGSISLHQGQTWQAEALEHPVPIDLHGSGLTFSTTGVQQITAYYLL